MRQYKLLFPALMGFYLTAHASGLATSLSAPPQCHMAQNGEEVCLVPVSDEQTPATVTAEPMKVNLHLSNKLGFETKAVLHKSCTGQPDGCY